MPGLSGVAPIGQRCEMRPDAGAQSSPAVVNVVGGDAIKAGN